MTELIDTRGAMKEPEMEERKRLGFIVMSFLIIFVFLMYLSTKTLWRDVH